MEQFPYTRMTFGTVLFALFSVSSLAGETPKILSVRGRNVQVEVPAGLQEVTLQRKTAQRKNPWITLAKKDVDGTASEVSFALAARYPKNNLRVLGREFGGLPLEFFKGPSLFLGEKVVASFTWPRGSGGSGGSGSGGGSHWSSGVTMVFNNGHFFNYGNFSDDFLSYGNFGGLLLNYGETDPRALVNGDRAYFINEFRGLQTLDISSPAAPVLLGELKMQGGGQEIHQLDTDHVVVIRQTSVFGAAELVVCNVSGPTPIATGRVPMVGDVAHFKLVGTSLFTASSIGTITGYDLSNPSAPVLRNSVTFAAERTTVSQIKASDRCFMIVTTYHNSVGKNDHAVHLVDLSQPGATVAKTGSVALFEDDTPTFIHEQAGVLTVGVNVPTIASSSSSFSGRSLERSVQVIATSGSPYRGSAWNRSYYPESTAVMKNFAVANLAAPTALGELILNAPHRMYIPRLSPTFDGSRMYIQLPQISPAGVYTYPVSIIDNSNPVNPTLAGTVPAILGTVVAPLGDRLVTISSNSPFTSSEAIVSLFDVTNPAQAPRISTVAVPQATSTLGLNGRTDWTWAPHAFRILPQDGIIVVQSASSRPQLIELTPDSVSLRGSLPPGFAANRFSLKGDSLLAFGAYDFRAADIADRDHPTLVTDTELAWSVNRVWPVENYLVQLGTRIDDSCPVISVSTPSNPHDTLGMLTLDPGTVKLSSLSGDLLYIVQMLPDTKLLKLSAYSITSLPHIVKLSEAVLPLDTTGTEFTLLFPNDSTAVICEKNPSTIDDPASAFLTAFDCSNPRKLQFLNRTRIETDDAASLSPAFAQSGKVFMSSHQPNVEISTSRYDRINRRYTLKGWSNRYFLNVVDFSNPTAPEQPEPIGFPGPLHAVDRNGKLLYATGPEYGANGYISSWRPRIYALALDSAAHVAATTDATGITGEMRVRQGLLVATRANDPATFSLESWALSDAGEFTLRSAFPFDSAANWRFSGDLIFNYNDPAQFKVYDASDITALPKVLTISISADAAAYYGSKLDATEGTLSGGFWFPRGNYGVTFLPPQ